MLSVSAILIKKDCFSETVSLWKGVAYPEASWDLLTAKKKLLTSKKVVDKKKLLPEKKIIDRKKVLDRKKILECDRDC